MTTDSGRNTCEECGTHWPSGLSSIFDDLHGCPSCNAETWRSLPEGMVR